MNTQLSSRDDTTTRQAEGESRMPSRRKRHPEPEELSRFMRAELEPPEVLAVVRHLLTGCERCVAVTGRDWRLRRLPPYESESPAVWPSDVVIATREQLRTVAEELSKSEAVLRDLAAILSVQEGGLWEYVVRNLILIVLQDRIEPAIQALHTAASYDPLETARL